MKKYICLSILMMAVIGNSFAQIPEKIKRHYTNSFDVFTDIILDKPENFTPKNMNMGFGLSASYVIPLGKSDFSFDIGGGFSFHNFYSDALPKDAIPVDLRKESWGEDFYFMKLDSIGASSYSRNKIAVSYFDIPLEFKFCAKNGLKFTAGAKLSFIIGSHTKYKGYDYLYGTGETYKYKMYNLKNMSSFGITPVVRFGWKWFSIYASYALIPVYDAAGGNSIRPISIGISLTPEK